MRGCLCRGNRGGDEKGPGDPRSTPVDSGGWGGVDWVGLTEPFPRPLPRQSGLRKVVEEPGGETVRGRAFRGEGEGEGVGEGGRTEEGTRNRR